MQSRVCMSVYIMSVCMSVVHRFHSTLFLILLSSFQLFPNFSVNPTQRIIIFWFCSSTLSLSHHHRLVCDCQVRFGVSGYIQRKVSKDVNPKIPGAHSLKGAGKVTGSQHSQLL